MKNTPYDSIASISLHARTDVFMMTLMNELGITEFDTNTDCVSQWEPDEAQDGKESLLSFIKSFIPAGKT